MSLFRLTIAKTCSSLSKILIAPNVNSVRSSAVLFSTSPHRFCQANDEDTPDENDKQKKNIKPDRDRSTVIPVETSIQYLTSDAYKETYGTRFVWERYRRNHKGQLPPRKTRESCIIQDYVSTGNPCPICRDEYLIFHYSNLQLLKQFISPFTGEIISYEKTGVCQRQHYNLMVAVERAVDRGLIELPVPFRFYDYSEYYDSLRTNRK